MPSGGYQRITEFKKDKMLNDIMNNKVFGFVECDIKVNEEDYKIFEEMPPIFKNVVIPEEEVSDLMREYAKEKNITIGKSKKLISSMRGERILLFTPLLKWYLSHGLIVEKIHQVIQYIPNKCFSDFMNEVSDARRAGDADPNKKILAETMKLFGNSAYGYTVMNKEKHSDVKYCGESKIDKHINNPRFKDLNTLNNQQYEVMRQKKKIKMNLPIQIGCAVYQLAKLRMLEFYYDFIMRYISKDDFQYIEMDTDSAYIAFSAENIEDIIKPKMRAEYFKNKWDWFPQEKCIDKCNKCSQCKMALYERRTPGLFKEEFRGDGMIAICSKVYYCWNNEGKDKTSCKGVNKRQNDVLKEDYYNVLFDNREYKAVNKGFRVVNNKMYSYEQQKRGFSSYYDKRKVLDDGISTTFLNI